MKKKKNSSKKKRKKWYYENVISRGPYTLEDWKKDLNPFGIEDEEEEDNEYSNMDVFIDAIKTVYIEKVSFIIKNNLIDLNSPCPEEYQDTISEDRTYGSICDKVIYHLLSMYEYTYYRDYIKIVNIILKDKSVNYNLLHESFAISFTNRIDVFNKIKNNISPNNNEIFSFLEKSFGEFFSECSTEDFIQNMNEYILKNGVDINYFQDTFIRACEYGDIKIIKFFVDNGFNYNSNCKDIYSIEDKNFQGTFLQIGYNICKTQLEYNQEAISYLNSLL